MQIWWGIQQSDKHVCDVCEESQAYDRNCADIIQMNNGSLYTSKPDHELD